MHDNTLSNTDFISPDIETASLNYSKRFCGVVGKYFLERQKKIIESYLPETPQKLRILEVGGGHCQLTEDFLKKGHEVWVHGSSEKALWKVDDLEAKYPTQVKKFISDFDRLDIEDKSFDVVVSIRLMSHIKDWKKLVSEMCRISKSRVIFDFPPKSSFNIFYPFLFKLKKWYEKDTRPFRSFTKCNVNKELKNNGFIRKDSSGQFFIPMVIHRFIKKPNLCKKMEFFSASVGLTKFFGSPIIVVAEELAIML